MPLVKGKFTLTWGDNTLDEVEDISVEYEQDAENYQTVQHQTFEVDGPRHATVTFTLLGTDTAALAAVLPQHHVANGETLSTGETVDEANGAIDIYDDCDTSTVYNDLDIESCANPGDKLRLVNARSKLEGVEFDNKLRKVMVKFVGEPDTNEGVIQFFESDSISVVS